MIANRVDANQDAIVDALWGIGATVQRLQRVKGGCPDLLVGYRGVNHVLEVKDGSKPPSRRKLTPQEKRWQDAWRGTVRIVYSVDDAIEVVTGIPF